METLQVAPKPNVNYNQPSLPSLLTHYGLEDKHAQEKRKEKEEEKERRKEAKKLQKKSQKFDDGEDEKALLREKEKEEHYLKLVKDLYRLRDYYYSEYTSLLGDKVEKQRKEIREKDVQKRCQQEKEDEEKRKASHTVKKRLERCTLETTPSTTNVPKSDIYYIIGLEEKLRREGKLKTHTDYNRFREEIEEPRTFYKTFKVKKTSDLNSYPSSIGDHASVLSHSHTSRTSHADSQEQIFSMSPSVPAHTNTTNKQDVNTAMTGVLGQRTLGRIAESREPSRAGNRGDHWAITQQYPAVHKKRRSLAPGRKSTDAQSDLEKRFPKLEMPKLHCFTMDLAKKPPDPEEVRQQAELRAREKQRKRASRTYTKMYQLAMSNAAVSNRIMDQHEDMDMIINGPDLCDVIADHHWLEAYGLQEMDLQQPQEEGTGGFGSALQQTDFEEGERREEIELGSGGDALINQVLSLGPSRESSAASSVKSQGSREERERKGSVVDKESKKAKTGAASPKSGTLPELKTERPLPTPLTMTEIKDKCGIVEAKTLSTLWNNYLGAGRSQGQQAL